MKTYIYLLCLILIVSVQSCDTANPERNFREWYIPNGIFTTRDISPENRVYDVTGYAQEWIHILNVSENDATVTVTFYTENEPPRDTTYNIAAGHSQPFNIDQSKTQKVIKPNTLYGIRIKSTEDVMPQVTRHESENTSPDIPPSNHLQSNIGYPGPLGNKEKDWLYVDCWSLTSDPTWIEKEWINILNPGKEEAEVTLTFIDRPTGARTKTKINVSAERIFTMDLTTLPADIYKERRPISVKTESSHPVVVMQIRRFFHSGNQSPRGMIGSMAYPVGGRNVFSDMH